MKVTSRMPVSGSKDAPPWERALNRGESSTAGSPASRSREVRFKSDATESFRTPGRPESLERKKREDIAAFSRDFSEPLHSKQIEGWIDAPKDVEQNQGSSWTREFEKIQKEKQKDISSLSRKEAIDRIEIILGKSEYTMEDIKEIQDLQYKIHGNPSEINIKELSMKEMASKYYQIKSIVPGVEVIFKNDYAADMSPLEGGLDYGEVKFYRLSSDLFKIESKVNDFSFDDQSPVERVKEREIKGKDLPSFLSDAISGSLNKEDWNKDIVNAMKKNHYFEEAFQVDEEKSMERSKGKMKAKL